jgi:hypothetical protein
MVAAAKQEPFGRNSDHDRISPHPDGMTLVAIDIAEDGQDVLIEPAARSSDDVFGWLKTLAD